MEILIFLLCSTIRLNAINHCVKISIKYYFPQRGCGKSLNLSVTITTGLQYLFAFLLWSLFNGQALYGFLPISISGN